MARARFIRPEFFTDEKVSDLPFGACLLFAGIWCQSDLRGVFECSPRLLRGLIFPMRDGIDTATIGQWLNDLERSGMFRRFEAEDKQWGQVTNWSRHQEVTVREVEIGSRRPTPSDWADPVEWSEIVEKARKNHRIAKSSPWNDSRTVPEPNQNPTPTATATPTATDACVGKPAHTRGGDVLAKALRRRGLAASQKALREWGDFLLGSCRVVAVEETARALDLILEAARRDGVRVAYYDHAAPFASEVARRLRDERKETA